VFFAIDGLGARDADQCAVLAKNPAGFRPINTKSCSDNSGYVCQNRAYNSQCLLRTYCALDETRNVIC